MLTIILASCQSVRPLEKKRIDVILSNDNIKKFNGTYKCGLDSSNNNLYSFWQRIHNAKTTIDTLVNSRIEIETLSFSRLKVSLSRHERVIDSIILIGKVKKGYFVLKNRFKIASEVGPLLWGIGGFKIHMGLTQDNDLVLFESKMGMAIVLLLPLFVSGDRHNFVYKRIQ